jgi:hypothetical protein
MEPTMIQRLALALFMGSVLIPVTTPAQPAPPFKKNGLKKGGPIVGDQAPDFELKYLDSKETFKLSTNFGKRPTVLIFHSFT